LVPLLIVTIDQKHTMTPFQPQTRHNMGAA